MPRECRASQALRRQETICHRCKRATQEHATNAGDCDAGRATGGGLAQDCGRFGDGRVSTTLRILAGWRADQPPRPPFSVAYRLAERGNKFRCTSPGVYLVPLHLFPGELCGAAWVTQTFESSFTFCRDPHQIVMLARILPL